METQVLEELGLTKNEIKIYTKLLKGSMTAGTLTKKTGIHRRNVYDCIERLIEKGLVSYVTVDNKKYFNAANPKRFEEIIQRKKREIKKTEEKLSKIMPELSSIKQYSTKHDVRFFRGRNGIKTVYEDILNTKQDYVGYGPGKAIEEVLKHYFKHFIDMRIKLKIKARLIYPESSRKEKYVNNPNITPRFLPDEFSSHSALRIYDDKTVIILYSDEPLAILIKNKSIAMGYKKYFEFIWKNSKK